ncbi:CD225/dispanin family protein [Chitinilyticum piscinae]|uniref:CD225/dispanin family protein n=1 Tax=Chitinilyticum piscinae TaxID=2866724 RepID=A0A8J7FZ93_9NEIS|nr:CD225/dispanin family protein [Chitinilyticum piscinae]MBE9608423.1 CD225/dispanin family protein [Chitinilyticum piscinae]
MPFCTKCGANNPDEAQFCSTCGATLTPAPTAPAAVSRAAPAAARPSAGQPEVPSYLVQSILVTLCCCLPFGIASIVFASQVNSKLAAGDLDGALESSRKAKMWAWWGFGVGIAVNILAVIAQFGAIAASGL